MEDLQSRLKDKSIEAFLLAIEIYNKPTIKYRVEGFALFIVNAWELMLKSYLIKKEGESSIYFPDQQNRTISLEGCLKKVFTNEKDPLRLNLEKIIELRNISTHYITQEYEFIYVPLFQSCIDNFAQKIKELLDVEIIEYIPENFLTLPVSIGAFDETKLKGQYSVPISSRLLDLNKKIEQLKGTTNSTRFAVCIVHDHFITKKKDEASDIVHIAKDGEPPVMIMKEVKDPKNTHPFTTKMAINAIKEKLRRNSITLTFRGCEVELNKFHFSNICKQYFLKDDIKYCYAYKLQKNPQYSYSQATIDFVYNILIRNPNTILDELANRFRLKKTIAGKPLN